MKIALIADWLTTMGGAEHVIADFCRVWPEAPLYTTVCNEKKMKMFAERNIHVTGLQKWYKLLQHHQLLLPWMPGAIEKIDLTGYDVILSSSHAVAKGIVTPAGAKHVCYCHTPMRYAWEMEDDYLSDYHVPRLLWPRIRRQLKRLRRWDLTTAQRVDQFIANSRTVQERIQRVYNRDSIVLQPPASDHFYDTPIQQAPGAYFLALGRLIPYKRFDLLIEAANKYQFPLKIAGKGQEETRLRAMAGPTVEFLGFVSDEELPALYAGAKAFLFPQFEDAGVVPIEAQACGTPVIAYGKGGALDTVQDGVSGLFFEEQSVESLGDAIQRFNQQTFDAESIREWARQFSSSRFREAIAQIVIKESEGNHGS